MIFLCFSLLGNYTSQREMASSSNPEKDNLATNPYFNKYKAKLKHLQE